MTSPTWKTQRDRLLGIAALLLAARYLLFTMGVASSIRSYNFGSLRLAATTVLVLLGDCVRVAGFIFVALCFLGASDDRARKPRSGTWVIAGGFFAIFASSAIAVGYDLSRPQSPLSGSLAGRSIVQVLATLGLGTACALAAFAFGSETRAGRRRRPSGRDRGLGVASIGFAVAFALSVIADLLGRPEGYELAANVLLLLACVIRSKPITENAPCRSGKTPHADH
jgi:hypothetical protein